MTLQHSPASQPASTPVALIHSYINSVRANTPPTPSLSDNGVHLAKYGGGRTVNNSTGLLVANPNPQTNGQTNTQSQARRQTHCQTRRSAVSENSQLPWPTPLEFRKTTHTPQSKQKQKQPKENVNKTRKENKMWYKWGKKLLHKSINFAQQQQQ